MWDRIRVFFKDSETIAWARIQLVVGAVWTVLAMSDLSGVLPAKWLPYWLILSGIITELSRRAREPHDLGVKTVADLSTVMVPVKKDDELKINEATGTVVIEKAAEPIPAAVLDRADAKV